MSFLRALGLVATLFMAVLSWNMASAALKAANECDEVGWRDVGAWSFLVLAIVTTASFVWLVSQ